MRPAHAATGDTARVTHPRTGFPFLDAGLEHAGSVLAFAHRGGAFHPEIEGLENTLAAFEHAVGLGYHYLETDVHATSDGVLLAFHDAALDRVTDSTGSIAALAYAQVARAVIGGREQVPTLASLLDAFPQARFNIDIKSEAAIGPLVSLIESRAARDRVCVGSFNARMLRSFRMQAGRRVATAAVPAQVAAFRVLPGRLADVLLGPGADVLQVPHRYGPAPLVTEAFVARAHAQGRPVHVWTVDDPAEMRELLDLGVDGIMTDRTDLLREVLLDRGQWMGAPA
jgi:glycerophosphoryl diester phosphodiesterase